MNIHRLGKRLMILQLLRRRKVHGQNSEKEIVPGQYPLLNYLSKNPEATQQELATMLFVSPASVAQSTKRLQKAGLLEKQSNPQNLRENRLRVTEAGQEVVNRFGAFVDNVDKQTFRGFNDAEIDSLVDMLNRMIKNLATDADMDLLRSMEEKDKSQ